MISVDIISVGPLQSNCYILSNEQKLAVIIDAGDDFERIDRFIIQNGLSVNALIFTHGHFDHIGAGKLLHDKYLCDVYIHKDDTIMLCDSNLNLSSRILNNDVLFDADVISVGEQTISLIGNEFTFIHTPGHTPGSMCIKTNDCLFTGDTLFKLSVGNSFPPYGDLNLEIKSIKEKLFSLDDLTCYPGHGEITSIEYEKNFNPYTNQGEQWI